LSSIIEKILAFTSGRDEVSPGDIVEAEVDAIMVNDIILPLLPELLNKLGSTAILKPERVAFVPDHLVPVWNVNSAEIMQKCRCLCQEYGLSNLYDFGRHGIGHQIMVEKGHVLPGKISIGTDSHATIYGGVGSLAVGVGIIDAAVALATGRLWFKVPESVKFLIRGKLRQMVTAMDIILHVFKQFKLDGEFAYKAIEFGGPSIKHMSVAGRMTICGMAADLGVKTAIVGVDNKALSYLKNRTRRSFQVINSDPDAVYEKTLSLDVSDLDPQVGCPHSPDNVRPAKEVEGIKIDQAFLGTCINGREEDLKIAAQIINGHKIHPNVRMVVQPASQTTYMNSLRKGYITTFLKAGATLLTPGCSPCNGHVALLGPGEVAIVTAPRNYQGRMGSSQAKIYLASPATVAASAISGEITSPQKIRWSNA
jgi:3-isopropylmalate/(R)-2-methylmalate dehydratase large subunit